MNRRASYENLNKVAKLLAVGVLTLAAAWYFGVKLPTHHVSVASYERSELPPIADISAPPASERDPQGKHPKPSAAPAIASASNPAPNPPQRARGIASLFPDATLIERREEQDPVSGNILRTSLVMADFKYPYVRLEEIVRRHPSGGRDEIIRQVGMVADHILVRVQPGTSRSQLEALNARFGASIRKEMSAPGMYIVQIDAPDLDAVSQALAAYQREGEIIEHAEPDYIVSNLDMFPDDPNFGELYGLHNTGQSGGTPDADIDAPEAWDLAVGNASVLVGVIDTGVDYTHADLAANMWNNPGEIGLDANGNDKRTNGIDDDANNYIDDYRGWDFYNEDNDPFDDGRHGTHVAGTIGALGNNSVGVAGVCWDVSIVGLKFLAGFGGGTVSDAIEAVIYSLVIEADLTSNSWGGSGYSDFLEQVIGWAGNLDALFIAAAGNSASDNDAYAVYPAGYTNDNVIAVAAVDRDDAMAYFSNYGATTVDLAAHGVDVLSTVPGDDYDTFSGTSMATPHVSGVVALLRSLQPNAPYLEVKSAVLSSVDPLPAMAGLTLTGGRLNARKALELMGMNVSGSSPARGEVVFAKTQDVAVDFVYAYDPGSVEAADLTVNGITADSVTLVDSNSVVFHYVTSPVVTQGVQTMSMASGAVTRLNNADPLGTWNAVFRYDAMAMQIATVSPVDGATVPLPFTLLQIDLNEPYDPASVFPDDVVLSGGAVAAINFIDAYTIAFVLTNLNYEAGLSVSFPAGAFTDVFGNPSLPFVAEYELDASSRPFPQKFRRILPQGTLAYDTSVQAIIHKASDVDEFTADLDANQTLSIAVMPSSNLQVSVTVLDPVGASIASAVSPGNGHTAILQLIPLPTAGTYTVRIESSGMTAGGYELRSLLNAAWELEERGGAQNDDLDSAESIDSFFLPIHGAAERIALVGTFSDPAISPFYMQGFDAGAGGFTFSNMIGYGTNLWHVSSGRQVDGLANHTPPGSLYYGQNETDAGGGDYDAGTNGGVAISPLINVPDNEFLFMSFSYLLETEGSALWDEIGVDIDIGNGFTTLVGNADATLPSGSDGTWLTQTLDMSSYKDTGIVLRFRFEAKDHFLNEFEGWYVDDVQLAIVREYDCFALHLETNDLVSIALTAHSSGHVEVELLDSSTNVLAFGSVAPNLHGIIQHFNAPTAGTYYIRASGLAGEYSLFVTKNAAIDTEPNNELMDAQLIASSRVAVGALVDGYTLDGFDDGNLSEYGDVDGHSGAEISTNAAHDGPYGLLDTDSELSSIEGWLMTKKGGLTVAQGDTMSVWIRVGSSNEGRAQFAFGHSVTTTFGVNVWIRSLAVSLGPNNGTFNIEGHILGSIPFALGGVPAGQRGGDDVTHAELASSPQSYIAGQWYRVEVLWEVGGVITARLYDSDGVTQLNEISATFNYVYAGGIGFRAFGPDICFDTLTLESGQDDVNDCYAFNLADGERLLLETMTPADGAREFLNDLDPRVELFDPSGALVAQDDNGDVDGRNIRLSYLANTSGVYKVRLDSGEGSTSGEYILKLTSTPDGLDSDGDYMPDWWELFGGGNPTSMAAYADADMDNLPNVHEYVAGTRPFDSDSLLEIMHVTESNDMATVVWRGGTTAEQRLICTTSLVSGVWQDLYTNVPPTPITNTVQYPQPNGRSYYRIQVLP